MKISQLVKILEDIQAENGDLDVIVLEGEEDGFSTFDVELVSNVDLEHEEGKQFCAIISPELADDLEEEVNALEQKPKLTIVKKD